MLDQSAWGQKSPVIALVCFLFNVLTLFVTKGTWTAGLAFNHQHPLDYTQTCIHEDPPRCSKVCQELEAGVGGGRGRRGGGAVWTAQHPWKSKRSYVKGVCSKTADADVKNANATLWGERKPDLGREAVCMAFEPQLTVGELLLHSAVWFRILPEISEGSFISPFSRVDSTDWKEARQRRPYAAR